VPPVVGMGGHRTDAANGQRHTPQEHLSAEDADVGDDATADLDDACLAQPVCHVVLGLVDEVLAGSGKRDAQQVIDGGQVLAPGRPYAVPHEG
jgi:hypothetical protein